MNHQKRIITIILTYVYFSSIIFSQKGISYKSPTGETHFVGVVSEEDFNRSSIHKKWFNTNKEAFELSDQVKQWANLLSDVEVEIYMGTWCSDSRKWVPSFLKAWEELDLKKSQINITALYGEDMVGQYKQSINGEEKGKGIHHVPTFIFKREGKEISRIVEAPMESLEADLLLIAYGYSVHTRYVASSYIVKLFEENPTQDYLTLLSKNSYHIAPFLKSQQELTSLGYWYMEQNKTKESLSVLELNTKIFPYSFEAHDQYALALTLAGKEKEAKKTYERLQANLNNQSKNVSSVIKNLSQED